jgi:hypothetical protein
VTLACKDCVYFEPEESECRLLPPRTFMDDGSFYTSFPTVKETEWCGEYQEREDAKGIGKED